MTDSNNSSDSEPINIKTKSKQKGCNYCNRISALVDNKPYCILCDKKCYRECRRCHRPHDSSDYFTLDPEGQRCNSCQNKYLKQRNKRIEQQKRKAIASNEAVGEPKAKKASVSHNQDANADEDAFKMMFDQYHRDTKSTEVVYLPVLVRRSLGA